VNKVATANKMPTQKFNAKEEAEETCAPVVDPAPVVDTKPVVETEPVVTASQAESSWVLGI
jgi:hypothetical protein